MKNALLAGRYALAFLDNIKPEDYSSLSEDIAVLHKIFSENPKIVKSLQSLIFADKKKNELLDLVLDGLKHKKTWHSLFSLVIKKHRASLISKIVEQAENLLLERQGKSKINIVLARKHNEETVKVITDYVNKLIKKELLVTTTIKPSIIGGFIANVDSLTIDGSVSHNLDQFSKRSHS